jgi:hypothetical protein
LPLSFYNALSVSNRDLAKWMQTAGSISSENFLNPFNFQSLNIALLRFALIEETLN